MSNEQRDSSSACSRLFAPTLPRCIGAPLDYEPAKCVAKNAKHFVSVASDSVMAHAKPKPSYVLVPRPESEST